MEIEKQPKQSQEGPAEIISMTKKNDSCCRSFCSASCQTCNDWSEDLCDRKNCVEGTGLCCICCGITTSGTAPVLGGGAGVVGVTLSAAYSSLPGIIVSSLATGSCLLCGLFAGAPCFIGGIYLTDVANKM